MTAILALLSTGVGKAILAALAGLIAIAGAYFKGRTSGKSSAETAQKAKEAQARAEEIDRIKRAAGATPTGDSMSDPYNRDGKS